MGVSESIQTCMIVGGGMAGEELERVWLLVQVQSLSRPLQLISRVMHVQRGYDGDESA